MLYSQRTSVLLLSLVEFLERFSYYGVRTLIILYVTSDLGME
jgi:dipeptide/tripeptide permease